MKIAAKQWVNRAFIVSLLTLMSLFSVVKSAYAEDSSSLTNMLVSNLGITEQQAQGGMGALLNLAKTNLSGGEFSSLLGGIAGGSDMLSATPEVKAKENSTSSMLGSLGGNSLKALADSALVKEQFEALGLSPKMIGSFVDTSINYLQSEQGQQMVDLFKKGVTKLL
ncbi:DUF2780 domain-containing protein [Thalassotalea euphylliae]|uniref:DUF2780 domain-containing protein n=1 Tax=Thalassotalea euphylliae TaxID=1655234 RepID=UPI003645259C